MSAAPSLLRQRSMLARLRSGMVLAGHDQPVLRYLQLRRYVRAHPLFDPRHGKLMPARAWQITEAGVAAAMRLDAPRARTGTASDAVRQIDLEEAIAASAAPGAPL